MTTRELPRPPEERVGPLNLILTVLAAAVLLTGGLVAVGSQPASAAPANVQMPFPCGETWHASTYSGHTPSEYSVDWNLIGAEDGGRPVLSGVSGTATVLYDSGYGNYVEVSAGGGWVYRYGHLASVSVANNSSVSPQTTLGTVGTTGSSTGNHLHYEQRYNGVVQPATFNGSAITYVYSYNTPNPYTSANCAGSSGNAADIFAINMQDAGSNSTAVHVVNGNNVGQYLMNTGSALITTNATWDFATGDLNHDGRSDVWAFNRNPGGSNTVVHVLNGQNPTQYLQAGNIVLPGVSQDWTFALGDYNGDGTADIYAINRAPGTSHTEVRVINGANWGLYLQQGNIVLPAADASWAFGVGNYNGDAVPDIYAINRHDVGSNSTAVHVVNGSNWGMYLANSGSALIQTSALWDFALGDLNDDGRSDVWSFNRNPGGTNTVIHVLNGTNFNQYLQAGNIVLPGTDANWVFRMGVFN